MEASVKNKVSYPGVNLYIVFVKQFFKLDFVLVSASYTSAHENFNALLKAVKGPIVDFCAAETLSTFIDGPGPLTDLDDVNESARCNR